MSSPTLQQTNLVNSAARAAKEGFAALADLQAYLVSVEYSQFAAGVATADFTDPTTPGPLVGFNPADYAAFNAAAGQIVALVQANNGAVGKAFAALYARA